MIGILVAAGTAFRVIHDTVTVVLPDSARMLVGNPIRVDLSAAIHERPWWLDGLIALGSAVIGATLGGKLASNAALRAMREEARQVREVSRAQLLGRLRLVLPRIGSLGQVIAGWGPEQPIRPDMLESTVALWEWYDRLSDRLIHVAPNGLASRIHVFIMEAGIIAKGALETERRVTEFRSVYGEEAEGAPTETAKTLRQQTIAVAGTWSETARQLIAELEEVVDLIQ